jgi:hypothetical protein
MSIMDMNIQTSIININIQTSIMDMNIQTSIININIQMSIMDMNIQTSIINMNIPTSIINMNIQTSIININIQTSIININIQTSTINITTLICLIPRGQRPAGGTRERSSVVSPGEQFLEMRRWQLDHVIQFHFGLTGWRWYQYLHWCSHLLLMWAEFVTSRMLCASTPFCPAFGFSYTQFFLFWRDSLPPPVGQRLLIHEVSRSHTTTYHSREDFLWTSDQLVAETSTWQHITLTTNINAPRWDFFTARLLVRSHVQAVTSGHQRSPVSFLVIPMGWGFVLVIVCKNPIGASSMDAGERQRSHLEVPFAKIVEAVPDTCLCSGSFPSASVLSNGPVWGNPWSRAGRDGGDSGDDNIPGVPKSKSGLSVVAVASIGNQVWVATSLICVEVIRTHNLSRRAAADLRLRPRVHQHRLHAHY